ncbi:tyrosine-type recombinase/integrase [Methylobacterium sp. C25]|uniref:DUF6538 domain-containing protein n=1 Tax=Methylobacterium sp. C25 TaxID=2721622 RepID=UPI002D80DCB5|nr:DUF6538 domain-containing protein [Methylobacterium sp. C25]MCE4224922.1 tyrosine-type recombinase/integrase [Methylobacterium sp. C25]
MLFRLVRSVKRSDSSLPQFVQRIPSDVRARAVGRTLSVPLGSETAHITITPSMASLRLSLKTRDPSEAKARQGQVAATVERFWTALRNSSPATLSHRQATALAGDLYRAWADGGGDRTVAIVHTGDGWVPDRSTPDEERAGFEAALGHLETAIESTDSSRLERLVGPLVDRLLLAKGIAEVDADSRSILLDAFVLALRDAFEVRKRNAEGDYSPDLKATRFPAFEAPSATPSTQPASKTSLTGLVVSWWAERKAAGLKPSTHESYRNTMANFVAFLKHDDAARVTAANVIGFKDHRLASINPRSGKPITAKTVKENDIAGLRTVFAWAVANQRMTSNPAKEVTLKLGKTRKLRSKGFTDEEARAILEAASGHQGGTERPQTTAAKRWVPWLQCYTGARVGELAQLRKQDLRREGEHWLINITPEAGTVKSNEAREVVLHPHLIELGFAEFVLQAPSGHLFLRPAKDGDVLGPLQGIKNRLAEFARAVVTDPNVAPNHGWRHRFKTVGLDAGINERVLDAIQGHAPRTAGEGYGEVSIKAMVEAVSRLPKIAADQGGCS